MPMALSRSGSLATFKPETCTSECKRSSKVGGSPGPVSGENKSPELAVGLSLLLDSDTFVLLHLNKGPVPFFGPVPFSDSLSRGWMESESTRAILSAPAGRIQVLPWGPGGGIGGGREAFQAVAENRIANMAGNI